MRWAFVTLRVPLFAMIAAAPLMLGGCEDRVAAAPERPQLSLAPGSPCLPPGTLVSWWPGIPQPFTQQLVVNDGFDVLNTNYWSPFGTGVVGAQSGKLLVQTDLSGGDQNTGLAGQNVSGDFEVVVDYSNFEVFAHASPVDVGSLTLSVRTPTLIINFQRSFIDGANVISGDVDGVGLPGVPYSDAFGQLRIVRTGTTVTLQFRRTPTDAFTTFFTGPWVTDAARVLIYARNDNFGTGVRGFFDNYQVRMNVATAKDVIGGNDGQLLGGAFSLGKVGQAFDLSTGGVITLPQQPPLSQGFSIAGWVKFDGRDFDIAQEVFNNNQVFLRKNPADEGNTFGVFITLADGSVEPRANSLTAAVPGVFYHLTATWDGANLLLYVNGNLEGVSSREGPLTSQTATAQIGQGEGTRLADNSFFGLIDEVAIADHAIPASQVSAAGACP